MFVVNPPDVDELDDVERITGFHELFRQSKGHPLNQKETASAMPRARASAMRTWT